MCVRVHEWRGRDGDGDGHCILVGCFFSMVSYTDPCVVEPTCRCSVWCVGGFSAGMCADCMWSYQLLLPLTLFRQILHHQILPGQDQKVPRQGRDTDSKVNS